jgi:NADH:ubiquinone oxidoreductase subunit F (NADH-binding)
MPTTAVLWSAEMSIHSCSLVYLRRRPGGSQWTVEESGRAEDVLMRVVEMARRGRAMGARGAMRMANGRTAVTERAMEAIVRADACRACVRCRREVGERAAVVCRVAIDAVTVWKIAEGW